MYNAYSYQLELPVHQQLDAHELVGQLVQAESLFKTNERTAYYLRLAKLRLPAIVEQVECGINRNFTKQQLATFMEGHYLKQGQNILTPALPDVVKATLPAHLETRLVWKDREPPTLI